MKAWRREEKIKLIESTNRKWKDLSYGWYQRHRYQPDLQEVELNRQRKSAEHQEGSSK